VWFGDLFAMQASRGKETEITQGSALRTLTQDTVPVTQQQLKRGDIMFWRSTVRKLVTGVLSTLAIATLAIAPAAAAASANTSPPPAATNSPPAPRPPVKAVEPERGSVASSAGISSTLVERNGVCDLEEFCMTYFSNGDGSEYDTAHNDPNLSDNHFISLGSGQGAVVGADSEFYFNHSDETVFACTGVNYTGQCLAIQPNGRNNFPAGFFNQVESIYWGDSVN
jgi:hypothetical protein